MSEKYLKWFPIDGIPFPLDLESYCRDESGIIIRLNSEDHANKILQIQYTDCEAFRELGDEFKSKFWHETDIEEDHALFIVENSILVGQFHYESENHFRDLHLKHYVIWTTENWIDILSSAIPVVKWKNK